MDKDVISHTHTHTYIHNEILLLLLSRLAIKEGFPGGASGKEPACQCRRQDMWVQSLDREDPLEEEMATHPSILAWETPETEGPGRLQSRASQRVGHD